MNKYKLVKFRLNDGKYKSPYTVTKITPKSNEKVNWHRSNANEDGLRDSAGDSKGWA